MQFRSVVISSIAVVGVLGTFAGVQALDTWSSKDLPWFANTNEDKSVYLSNLPDLTSQEADRTGPSIREYFSQQNSRSLICESDILAGLSQALLQVGVPGTRRTIRGALKLARSENLIDDVALTPLLWVLDAADPMPEKMESDEDSAQSESPLFPYAAVAPIKKTDAERKADTEETQNCLKEKRKKEEERNPAVLEACRLFEYANSNTQCSINAFKATAKKIRDDKKIGKGKKLKDRIANQAFEELKEKNVISQDRSEFYQRLYQGDIHTKAVTWLDFMQRAKKKDSFIQSWHTPGIPKFLSDKMKSGLSRRTEFYTRYNEYQFELLLRMFVNFDVRTNPQNKVVVTTVSRITNQPVLPAEEMTYPGQYCYATMILKEAIAYAGRSTDFSGAGVTFDDVAVAAIESGYVSANEVAAVVATDDVWNQKKSVFQKVLSAVTRYGSVFLSLVPPPYNAVSTLALTLAQGKSKKDTHDKDCKSVSVGEETVSSLFTTPLVREPSGGSQP